MTKSMTGFGRGENEKDGIKFIVEMKSVNHRYCEVNVRQPRKLSFLENYIKGYVKKRVGRGKVDLFISYEDNSEGNSSLKFNESLAREYCECFKKVSEDFNIENDIRVSHLTRYPEVLVLEEDGIEEEVLQEIVRGAIDYALFVFNDARETEGEMLKADIISKLDEMLVHIEKIKELSPQVIELYREKLHTRIEELMERSEIDESRIAMEVVLYADKSCVDEEIVRLISHIEHMKKTFNTKGAIGRKLDFITQEMNREANTVLSKTNVIDISNEGLFLKTEIEKIREQIQNIE